MYTHIFHCCVIVFPYSTHGLVHLVHARNIRTVGNISSLTEQQIQTLPIKSPKVENLKQALRNFQQQLVTIAQLYALHHPLGYSYGICSLLLPFVLYCIKSPTHFTRIVRIYLIHHFMYEVAEAYAA